MQAFVDEMRRSDNYVASDVKLDHHLPPIRMIHTKNTAAGTASSKKTSRIKSCDYDQWNKYDPGIYCIFRCLQLNAQSVISYIQFKRANRYGMFENGFA